MKGWIYDPLAARFTSADPVMQAPLWSQGLNLYSYAFNDPINNTDPSGFDVTDTIGGGFVVAGDAALAGGVYAGLGGTLGGIGGGAIAGGAGLGVGNVAVTLLGGGPSLDGSSKGGTYSVTPSAAPAARGASRESTSAVAQNTGGPAQQARQVSDENVPPAVPSKVHPGDPFADPWIRHELKRAWDDSNPSSDRDPRTHEEGGWIVRRSNGPLKVVRWKPGGAAEIDEPRRPPGLDIVANFHTHPNLGDDFIHGPSSDDWANEQQSPYPNYVISDSGVYKLTNVNEFLGPLYPSSPLTAGIVLAIDAAGVGAFTYAYLQRGQ